MSDLGIKHFTCCAAALAEVPPESFRHFRRKYPVIESSSFTNTRRGRTTAGHFPPPPGIEVTLNARSPIEPAHYSSRNLKGIALGTRLWVRSRCPNNGLRTLSDNTEVPAPALLQVEILAPAKGSHSLVTEYSPGQTAEQPDDLRPRRSVCSGDAMYQYEKHNH